ncbi:hypothetical protein PK34_21275 [Stutzerimonas stutzeri]|nr:hypothetical protein PK34_21275 [Stutzerimonas stutzeri]
MIMKGLKTGLACLLSIALVGCGEPAPTPPGVQYSVIKDESTPRKRVVEVVLAERVDQATLEQLARELKKSNSADSERTFIGWRIKGEEQGAYWAKTDFMPELKVTLLGASAEEHQQMVSSDTSVDGEVFGTWLSTWGFETKMVGYRKDGKTFIQSTFAKGGGVSTTEYVEQEQDGRRVLVDAEGSDFGEYMFVNADGALEFWSENGNFYTAPRAN